MAIAEVCAKALALGAVVELGAVGFVESLGWAGRKGTCPYEAKCENPPEPFGLGRKKPTVYMRADPRLISCGNVFLGGREM